MKKLMSVLTVFILAFTLLPINAQVSQATPNDQTTCTVEVSEDGVLNDEECISTADDVVVENMEIVDRLDKYFNDRKLDCTTKPTDPDFEGTYCGPAAGHPAGTPGYMEKTNENDKLDFIKSFEAFEVVGQGDDEKELPITVLKKDEMYRFKIKSQLPYWFGQFNDIHIEVGDTHTIEFELPDNVSFVVSKDFKFDPIKINGNKVAEYKIIDQGAGKFSFQVEFLEGVKGIRDFDLHLTFDAQLKLDEDTPSGDINFKYPFSDGKEFTIEYPPTVDEKDSSTKSDGILYDDKDLSKILWKIDVNKRQDALENLTITETLDEDQWFEEIRIYKVDRRPDGSIINDLNDIEPDKTISFKDLDKTNETVLNFAELFGEDNLDPKQSYYIEVVSAFDYLDKWPEGDEPNPVQFTNELSIKHGENSEIKLDSKYEILYPERITKVNVENPKLNNREFEWEVVYNKGRHDLGKVILTDTLDSRLELIESKLVIEDHEGNTLTADDYKVVIDPIKNTFQIELFGVTKELTITYRTKVKEDVEIDGPIEFNNTIGDGTKESGSSTTTNQAFINKSYENLDRETHTLEYKLTVNSGRRPMYNVVIKDEFHQPGIQYQADPNVSIQENIKVKYNGVILTSDKYHLATKVDSDTGIASFVITLVDTGLHDGVFEVTYEAKYDVKAFQTHPSFDNYSDENRKFFRNTATVEFTDVTGLKDYKPKSSTKFEILERERNNGSKKGTYTVNEDPTKDKIISWEILTNFNKNILENASLKDTLPAGLKIDENTVKFYFYRVDEVGNPVPNEEPLTDAELEQYIDWSIDRKDTPDYNKETDRDTLHVKFKVNDDKQILIKFDTIIAGDIVKKYYKNTATFTDHDKDYELKDTVEIPNGGELVKKNGSLDRDEDGSLTGILNWNVELNYSRSRIDGFVVTDTFTPNHMLDPDSVVLYKTKVGSNGLLVPAEKVDNEVENLYDLIIGTKDDDFTFKITFKEVVNEGYYLTYQSIADYRNSSSHSFSNKLGISGEITGVDKEDLASDKELNFQSGSGGGSVSLPSLSFQKLDQFKKPVEGARFELIHEKHTDFILTGESDKNGHLLFENVPKGTYYLTETKAPDGYQTAPSPEGTGENAQDGYRIETGIGKTDLYGNKIYNFKNTIRIAKASSAGVKDLSDAEFELYRVSDDGQLKLVDTKFTNFEGFIDFDGVNVGVDDDGKDFDPYVIAVDDKFIIKEKNPLPGHIKDLEEIKIEIKAFNWDKYFDEDGRPTEELMDGILTNTARFSVYKNVVNHKGNVYFSKVNADKENPLAIQGIGFKLVNVDDDQLSYSATSDKNGLVEFENVSTGTYALYEVKNSTNDAESQEDDYIRIEEKITEVTIVADNSDKKKFDTEGVPLPIELDDVVNYQGSVTLTKTDAIGKELEGATFELFTIKDGERKTTERTVTTGKNGLVTFKDLKPGEYSIKEIQAPAGYVLDDRYFNFVIEESSPNGQIHKDLDKHANLKGSITLTKKDGHDNILLSGAKFELYSAGENGTYLTYGITDKDGQVKFDQLAPGSYYVIESEAPEGYILNAAFKKEFEILGTLQEEQHIVETVNNYKGSIVVNKIDEHENVLEGAVFILKDANDRIRTAVVSPDKQIIFDQLEPGDYTLYEMVAPNGFIKELNSKTITIPESYDADEPYIDVVDLINYKGEITFTKQDALSKAPLEGVEYELTGPGYEDGEIFITDENGQISIKDLAVGDYQLVEVTPLDGYVLNTEVYEFTIEATSSGKPERITETFDNEKGSVKLTKYDYLGKVLEGVEFELFYGSDSLGTFTTNELGIIEIDDLAIGEYTFVETKTVDGHILNTKEFTFTVEAEVEGKVVQDPVEVYNYKQSVTFNKLDIEGNSLAGAQFKIYAIIDEVVAETATATAYSDDEGVVVFENLDVGEYIIRETKAAEGYYLNTKEVKVTIKAEHEGKVPVLDSDDFINYKGSISFTKYDEYEKALSGSVFELINEDNVVVDTQTSNEEGLVLFEEVAVGVYTVKEIEASTGYMINTTEVEVTVGYEAEELPETVVMEDFINYLGEVTFVKTDVNGDPLEGVEFELYQVVDGKVAETAFDKVSSDEEGVVYFKDLPVGDYVIKETKAKDGYYLNTDVIEFTIQDAYEGKMPVKELDPFVNYKGSITFKKTDVDGNGLVGSKFELIDSNEDVVQESISDDEGNVVFTEVEVGEYTIREVLATDGFIRNIQTVTVEVEKTAAGLPEAIVLEDFINYKGHVEFYKYDANDRPLEGAVFTVYDSEGKAVQEVSSDKKGRVYIDNLAVGEYTVKETQAPEGYLINTVEQTFVIIDLAHGLPEVIKLESVTNYKGSLMIHKVNDSGQFIAGAQFEVYDANNKLVSKFTNKSGIYHLEDLAPGRYTLVETKAPNGYRLAQKEYTFTIADSSNGVYTYDTLVVVNHLDGLPGTGIGSYMNYYMALTALGFVMVGLRVFHKKED